MVSEELVHGWHWLFFLGKAKTRQATKSRPEQHGMGIRALLSRALEFFDPDQRLYPSLMITQSFSLSMPVTWRL